MLVVGIGGGLRAGSATEIVLRAALGAASSLGASTALFAGPDLDLPMYAPGPRGARASALLDALRRADGVILASPAYHGTVSGLVKNALDYAEDLRDVSYLDGRAVGCIAVSGGAQAAASTLTTLRSVAHALRGWPTPLGVAVDGPLDEVILCRLDLLAEQVVTFAAARPSTHRRRPPRTSRPWRAPLGAATGSTAWPSAPWASRSESSVP
jgi:FMN reductase